MAANDSPLFRNEGFRLPLLRGFSNKIASYTSNNNNGQKSTLHRPSLKALIAYMCDGRKVWDDTLDASEIYGSPEGCVAGVAKIGNMILSEYRLDSGIIHLACFDSVKHQFLFAGKSSDGGHSWQPYILDYNDGQVGTVLWLALTPYLLSANEEFKAISQNLTSSQKSLAGSYEALIREGKKLPRSVVSQCFLYCDAAYFTVDRDGFADSIPCGIPRTVSPVFPGIPLDLSIYKPSPNEILSGEFTVKVLSNEKANGSKKKTVRADELFCLYPLEDNMSDEQKERATHMYDTYVVPKWVLKAAHNVQFHHKSTILSQEMKQNNLFLFGPPGSGKTDGAKAIASALGLPSTHISISSNSDETVFTGNIIPEVEGVSCGSSSTSSSDILKKYKSYDELLESAYMMPDVVYQDLTGKTKENASVRDCWDLISSLSDKENKGIKYKFVESTFCQAIEQGWLVTIEEFTNARDTGIGIIINQLMDGYQEITLPTGKKISRHPNTVIVFASNVDEAQCGEFEASTLSRLKPMYRIGMPTEAEMISRVKAKTGFDEVDTLNQMSRIIVALQKYVREHALVGVCGVREFIGWVLQYQANIDFEPNISKRIHLYNAAMETIVPSASPHEDDIIAVTRDIIDTMI